MTDQSAKKPNIGYAPDLSLPFYAKAVSLIRSNWNCSDRELSRRLGIRFESVRRLKRYLADIDRDGGVADATRNVLR